MIELSIKRVILLWKLQLYENMRRYLIGVCSIFLLIVIVFYQHKFGDLGAFKGDLETYLIFIYMVMGGLFATSLFKPLRRSSTRVTGLNLPVSAADRVSLALINTFILYPIVFFIVAVAGIYLFRLLWGVNDLSVIVQMRSIRTFGVLYFLVISISTLCAACFERFIEFKSILVLIAVMLLNMRSFTILRDLIIDVPNGDGIVQTADAMDNQEKWPPDSYRLIKVKDRLIMNNNVIETKNHYASVMGRIPTGMLILRGSIVVKPMDEDRLPFGVYPGDRIYIVYGKNFSRCYGLYLAFFIAGIWITIWLKIKEIEL